jgi:hypothetical protein
MPIHIIGQENSKYIVVLSHETNANEVLSNMRIELGTLWTLANSPKYVKRTYPDMDEWQIEGMVLNTMLRHGVDNVRGGSYQDEKLSDDDRIIVERNVKAIKVKYAIPIQRIARGHIVRKRCNRGRLLV